MSSKAVRSFLEEPRDAVLATISRDGTPQQTPISVYFDGESLYFRSDPDSFKLRHMRRDPRVSICVEDSDPPERYVVIRGRAEVFEGDWRAIYRALGEKYGSEREPPEKIERETGRVYMRVIPDRILGTDFSDA